MLDGIGATEMLHIFLTNRFDDHRPACTGRPVTGYEARIVDDDMARTAARRGRSAGGARARPAAAIWPMRGSANYVRDGWNLTGDSFWQDDEGCFHFAARTDDMIISAGYNIAGPEVEAALLSHPGRAGMCRDRRARTRSAARSSRRMWCWPPGIAADGAMVKLLAGPRQGGDRALQISAPGGLCRRPAQDRRPARSSGSGCAIPAEWRRTRLPWPAVSVTVAR